MIRISCIANGWKNRQSQTFRTRVGVQLVFAPRRIYERSVAVLWYILVRLWVELFVSQGLIQAETTVSTKASTWNKGNKDGNFSPYNCCLTIVLQCSDRKFLQSDCARKQVTMNMKGPQ